MSKKPERKQTAARFPLSVWEEMGEAMERLPRAVSRNSWIVEACVQRIARDTADVVHVSDLPLPDGLDPSSPPVSVTHGGVTFVPETWTSPLEEAVESRAPDVPSGVVLTLPDEGCAHKNTRDQATFGKICLDCNLPKSAW